MRRIAFYTLGCKVNQQETESLRILFEAAGYETVAFDAVADAYVINTCTVTQVSDKKSRQMIARAHARNPKAVIAVTGCYAQRVPEEVERLPGVRVVVGTDKRAALVSMLEEAREETRVGDIQAVRAFERLPVATEGARTRIQFKIQDGCDRYCSYCIIPYARGPVRSLPVDAVEAQLRELARVGVGELVLTGIHLMSYGKDLQDTPRLTEIVAMAAAQGGIGRVRLGSLEPALVDDAFVAALAPAAGKLCKQFHLSLQSGSDAVLARMRRRYTAEEYARAVDRLRRAFADCAITTDIIAGFPGETEAEHRETLEFAKRMAFARIHVFPYSARSGTRAAEFSGQLPKQEKERRAKEIAKIGKQTEQDFLQAQIGTTQELLAETLEEGCWEGYTGKYARIRVRGALQAGQIVPVRVLQAQDGLLLGAIEEGT